MGGYPFQELTKWNVYRILGLGKGETLPAPGDTTRERNGV